MVASTDRITMVRASCFTERQARFLVLVLEHAGVCLPRQYRASAGIAHGRHTHRFFEKLITGGFVLRLASGRTETFSAAASTRSARSPERTRRNCRAPKDFATTDLAAPAHAGRLYYLQYKP